VINPAPGARIYVVDDQPVNLRLLAQFLDRAGFADVHTFDDPRAALAAIEEHEPDLVLLDLHMPALDGFGVLGELGSRLAGDHFLPVLVLTADAERSARTRALSSGATDFLTKPFDGEEVVLRVRNLIRMRQLHRALEVRNVALAGEVRAVGKALADLEADYQAVAHALGRLTAAETTEATASAICAELSSIAELAAVTLLAFGAAESTVPLAFSPSVGVELKVNAPLPAAESAWLRARASGGTWIASGWPTADAVSRTLPEGAEGDTSAYVPLRSDRTTLGILVVSAEGPDAAARLAARLPALEAFGALSAALLAPGIEERQRTGAVRARVRRAIDERTFWPVFQPIVDLATGMLVGHEALTRFADGGRPDRWFADAAAVGLGVELEEATMESAIVAARRLPAAEFLSLNASPDLVLDAEPVARLLRRVHRPIVLELTEHVPVADYPMMRDAITRLGSSVRFAVDDAGSGFSSFRHIVELAPDFVKLDIGLVRTIEQDRARQAFVAGMVYFALRTNCAIVAEGIETDAERNALRDLAVDFGQGFAIGRPEPAPGSRATH
jgi:EAL domain-containing protein (putative c-di-GMP-specific phosphodiesterase class I)/DNA-binding response OmpR family regulator